MINLKKALTRQDPYKYQKKKIQVSGNRKKGQWSQLNLFGEKNQEKQMTETCLYQLFKKTIDRYCLNGQIKQLPKMIKELQQIYKEFKQDQILSSEGLLEVLRTIAKRQETAFIKSQIQAAISSIQALIEEKQKRQKQKCLKEFNKLVKEVQPKSKEIAATLKLVHSTSAGNLKIRFSREEFQFQQQPITKKKSLDLKIKPLTSNKNTDSATILQTFLKDSSLKLIKTKIQYDYSAILEASKSNIHPRNKTTIVEPQSEKQIFTKVSNGKKNQGFVFYRPNKKR